MDIFAYIDKQYQTCRKEVKEAVEAINMHTIHTGGGCMGWEWMADGNQFYIWITNEDMSLDGDPEEKTWIVGFYNQAGSFITFEDAFTLKRVIEIAEWLRTTLDERAEFWGLVMCGVDLRYRIEM